MGRGVLNPLMLVAGAGVIAGAMNALAGGGTFVTLPALITAGLPPVQANITSTVALYPSQLFNAWIYRDGLSAFGGVSLRALTLVTIIGGAMGAVLLLKTPPDAFDVVLPWLLLTATVALAFARQLGEILRRHVQLSAGAVIAIQGALGVYGGYFGGAVGLMMMAAWGLLHSSDMKSMAAPRTWLVGAANTVAVLIFLFAHAVYWHEALALLLGALLGGYLGAQVGKRAPSGVVRALTLGLSAGITLAFFAKAYRH
jgi:uncharacterized membrane protein YfcA